MRLLAIGVFSLFSASCGAAVTPNPFASEKINFTTCEAATAAKLYNMNDNRLIIESELYEDFPSLIRNLDNIQEIADLLKSKGVILVPIIIPQKPMVEGITEGSIIPSLQNFNRDKARTNYSSIISDLNNRGVIAPNLLEEMTGKTSDMFFRGDHHITPQGAQKIAAATAKTIKDLSAYNSISEVKYMTVEEDILTHPDPSRTGALINLCGPQPTEIVRLRKTERQDQLNLLDDEDPQIVYVGTSNGRPTWNLLGEFQQALSRDVLDAHIEAGGAYTPLLNYLLSKNYTDRPAKIILWEWNIEESFYNRDGSFEFSDPRTYQAVIPAINGNCNASNSILSREFSVSEEKVIELDSFQLTSSNNYLSISYSDKSIKEIGLTFSYKDGLGAKTSVLSPARITNRGLSFFKIPSAEKVSRITVHPNASASGNIILKVCKS